jgi:hypothetical protein
LRPLRRRYDWHGRGQPEGASRPLHPALFRLRRRLRALDTVDEPAVAYGRTAMPDVCGDLRPVCRRLRTALVAPPTLRRMRHRVPALRRCLPGHGGNDGLTA